jgi:S-adenosylmethionine:tRNA ribosyltransferase-isomerase
VKPEDFDFELPKELIAQTPAHPRDHARLLVYDRKTKLITNDYFYNLDEYLPENSTLVLNNSKVEKCRLIIGGFEVFVLEGLPGNRFKALVRPGKKFKEGTELEISGIKIKTLEVDATGVRLLELDRAIDDKSLDEYRQTPFPPYIHATERLASEYQTVYAKPLGSKAAPTAGLHFTTELLGHLRKKHRLAEVTLHVGLGTFAPISDVDIASKRLHEEAISIDTVNAELLNQATHITAVGTTSARVLESVHKPFKAINQLTDIFILPGYEFKAVDSLITNFHLPKSSLLMLVSALVGSTDEMHRIYQYAIQYQYRFYSFGDAMLII